MSYLRLLSGPRLPSYGRSDRTPTRHFPESLVFLYLLLGVLLILAFPSLLLAAPTTRVSVASDGTESDAGNVNAAISADGRYVAFQSEASNLVAQDENGVQDIFLRDLTDGLTTRVSVASDGAEADGESWSCALSADGRYVAFISCAANLVPADTNGWPDLFVHDSVTGETERVSVASDATEADNCSSYPSLSAEGRYLAFVSCATNLVADDTNDRPDVFVHDRLTGETERVSLTGDGTQADDCSLSASLSADGRYLAFVSCAANLAPGDTNGQPDVFVRDRLAGETERVSLAAGGVEANQCSLNAALSADGRYVAFHSEASNLLDGDTNGRSDVFLHDRVTGQIARVSVASDGTQGDGESRSPTLSEDGRFVTFCSEASNLIAADTNQGSDIFLRDRLTGRTERVSVATDGAQGDQGSYAQTITADGRQVAFWSLSSNLVAADTNSRADVFVRLRPAADFLADPTHGAAPLTVSFTDLSTGGPTGWEWDFGDGNTSSEEHPLHHYRSAGSYTVVLTVTDGAGWDSVTKVAYVTVGVPIPVADFSATPPSGPAPLEVTFTDLSSNTPTSWAWDFGDGGVSTDQHPSHTYSSPGAYAVSLTARNESGPDTETKLGYITVTVPTPVADFSATPVTGRASESVSFTDLSSNTPSAWAWTFGDGGASTAQHPTHEYVGAGLYTVTLTVTNAGGADTETKESYVRISFSDTPIAPLDSADYWALNQILACVDAGIVGGYPDGTYRPALSVTRDQMAVFIARALAGGDSLVPTGPATATFADVPTTHWALKYVEYAVESGVTGGYPDGTYRPTLTVTRDMMAVFMARAMVGGDSYVPTGPATAFFLDVPTTHWAFRYVEHLRGEEVAGGYPDGTYRPLVAVTRDQMAVYVQRAFALPM